MYSSFQLDFSRKHLATLQLQRKDYSFTYSPVSIIKYSFIQLSKLKKYGVNKIAKLQNGSERI